MDREKVINGLEGMIDYFFDIYRNETDSYKCAKAQEYSDCAIDAIAQLKEQEAVVRCKDCKHAGTFNGANGEKCFYCTKYAGYILNDWVTDGEWFCADGELKE